MSGGISFVGDLAVLESLQILDISTSLDMSACLMNEIFVVLVVG